MYRIIGADGREYGPVSGEQVRQWIAEGRVNAQTRVWVEGAGPWRPLVECAEFAPLPNAGPAPGPMGARAAWGAGPRTHPLATAGMVMGILSLTLGCCCYGLPFNLLGLIFSIIALAQIKGDPLSQQGRGQAIAGLVLSLFSLLMGLGMGLFSTVFNPNTFQRIQHL